MQTLGEPRIYFGISRADVRNGDFAECEFFSEISVGHDRQFEMREIADLNTPNSHGTGLNQALLRQAAKALERTG